MVVKVENRDVIRVRPRDKPVKVYKNWQNSLQKKKIAIQQGVKYFCIKQGGF